MRTTPGTGQYLESALKSENVRCTARMFAKPAFDVPLALFGYHLSIDVTDDKGEHHTYELETYNAFKDVQPPPVDLGHGGVGGTLLFAYLFPQGIQKWSLATFEANAQNAWRVFDEQNQAADNVFASRILPPAGMNPDDFIKNLEKVAADIARLAAKQNSGYDILFNNSNSYAFEVLSKSGGHLENPNFPPMAPGWGHGYTREP